MNKLPQIVLVLLTLFITTIAIAEEINIIYASKMPEIESAKNGAGGLAELGSLVKQERKMSDNFMFLHGGDSLAPSAMSSFDRGIHMIDILNSVKPDAFAICEREFAFKEDELIIRISESAFPFVSSNIYDPYTNGNLQGVEDNLCYQFGEYKICIIAFVDPVVKESYVPSRVKIDDDLNLIKRRAKSLKDDGADIVILMISHAEEEVKQFLKDGVVDLVFYASPDEDTFYEIGNGLILKQGTKEGKALKLNINIEKSSSDLVKKYSAKVISLKNYPPDPVVEKQIQYYLGKLSDFMGVIVGKSDVALDTRKKIVRTRETNSGNMIADALRNYYSSDIALINSGTIRGDRIYPAGTKLTRKDIQRILPFREVSKVISIKGKYIVDALENSFSLYENVKGRFPQVSGLKVEFCPKKPVGSRVNSVLVNGRPIEPDKEYSIALSDYLIRGGDGFTVLSNGKLIKSKKLNLSFSGVVRAYIENEQVVSPVVEGRIVNNCAE